MAFKPDTTNFSLFDIIIRRLGKRILLFILLLLFNFWLPLLNLSEKNHYIADKIIDILLTISFAAILIGLVRVGQDYVYHRYDIAKKDNFRERKIRTQLQFIRRILVSIIVVVAICAILLSFENLRKIGSGLLAGVGIGGIIIGFAAQRSLGNLLAGFQIAFTQPIRIDDALLVEGEFGRVEEITLTYVVLNLWDQRRLILPINYFIEKPFQNWTRTNTELLGTVEFYLDYNVPLEPLRSEFKRLLESSTLWDRRASAVQITENKEQSMVVRMLMSANNSGSLFDLRCYVRENIIGFINNKFPDSFSKVRNEYRLRHRPGDGDTKNDA